MTYWQWGLNKQTDFCTSRLLVIIIDPVILSIRELKKFATKPECQYIRSKLKAVQRELGMRGELERSRNFFVLRHCYDYDIISFLNDRLIEINYTKKLHLKFVPKFS